MLHAILTDPDNGYLYIRADGELTEDDYTNFLPAFRQLAESDERRLPVMLEFSTDSHNGSLQQLWHALQFDDAEQRKEFSRIAVVSDARPEPSGSALADLPRDAEVRFFERAKRANAEQWLLGQPMTELP